MLYTGSASGNAFWNFNPTRLVINDPIPTCVSDKDLRLTRPDGKEYKTTIVRVERGVVTGAARRSRLARNE